MNSSAYLTVTAFFVFSFFSVPVFADRTISNIEAASVDLVAVPFEISRGENVNLTFRGSSVSQIGKKISWKILRGSGSFKDADEKFDVHAEAKAVFIPDQNLKNGDLITLEGRCGNAKAKTTVSFRLFGQNSSDLEGDNILEYSETSVLTYKNLKPSSLVFWQADGDVKISKTPDEGFSYGLIDHADKNGVSRIFVKADPQTKNSSGQGYVKVLNEDQSFDGLRKNFIVFSYSAPDFVLPQSVKAGNDFEIVLEGLKPNTKVIWSDADQAVVQMGDQGMITYADHSGRTFVRYSVARQAKDHVKGIIARYYGYSDHGRDPHYFVWSCPELKLEK